MTAPPATASFTVHDPRFAAVLGSEPRLEQVVACDAHEGPVYVPAEDALYFTSVPRPGARVDIRRIALDGERFGLGPKRLSTVREDANAANGMALAADGRLIVCEQGTRLSDAAIAAIDPASGGREVLVDRWGGARLSSPNDVAVHPDGSIWFTDPAYGYLQGFRPRPEVPDRVYRLDPAGGGLSVVTQALVKPNGLAFSPDGRTLYVGDSGANQEPGSFHPELPHHVLAFDVLGDGRVGPPRLFADIEPGFPDGLKVDAAGRVYVSSEGGVQVFEPDGRLIGEIAVAGAVNFAFGGPRRDVLFITTDEAVWAAVLAATGPLPATGG